MKLAKDVTTHLFKYVKVVDIRFNPFDGRSKSVKELLRQVQATRYSKANPNLEIKKAILATADAPFAHFQFVDGSEVSAAVGAINDLSIPSWYYSFVHATFILVCFTICLLIYSLHFPLLYYHAHSVSLMLKNSK